MSSRRTPPAWLRRTMSHAAIAAVLLAPPTISWAGDVWLSCTATRPVAVLDAEKFGSAVAAGGRGLPLSEAEAQDVKAMLSSTSRKCWLKPGEKVHLQNRGLIRDPVWLVFSDIDKPCGGIVVDKSDFECGPPSDLPQS